MVEPASQPISVKMMPGTISTKRRLPGRQPEMHGHQAEHDDRRGDDEAPQRDGADIGLDPLEMGLGEPRRCIGAKHQQHADRQEADRGDQHEDEALDAPEDEASASRRRGRRG